jgi:hypothetical protein
MGMGVNTPKTTIPMVIVRAVPSRAVGGESSQLAAGCQLTGYDALCGSTRGLGISIKVGVQLGELTLDGGE